MPPASTSTIEIASCIASPSSGDDEHDRQRERRDQQRVAPAAGQRDDQRREHEQRGDEDLLARDDLEHPEREHGRDPGERPARERARRERGAHAPPRRRGGAQAREGGVEVIEERQPVLQRASANSRWTSGPRRAGSRSAIAVPSSSCSVSTTSRMPLVSKNVRPRRSSTTASQPLRARGERRSQLRRP